MPAKHQIDKEKKLIITTWAGEVEDGALIKSLSEYQKTIRSRAEYADFDDILDFSRGTHYHLSISGIQRLIEIATAGEDRSPKTRFAIVVTTPVAYSLARMYQIYRSIIPGSAKILRIFKTYPEALRWIESADKTPAAPGRPH